MISTATDKRRWWLLALCILICEATGIISALLSNTSANPWFDSLAKPSWNPPDSVFGPVWTTLYLLMGIALWVVWFDKPDGKKKGPAIVVFALQLVCNFLWSIFFFRLQSPFLALIDIVILDVLIVMTMVLFARHSKIAAYLLIPYLMWVLFATYLNWTIWSMN
jgi:tryptophan-rich sensory protein